jgi:xanthine dehydrogenase YagR molybdenum-binding subunit
VSAVGVATRAVGTPLARFDGPDKVTGVATYAFEWLLDRPAYLYPVQATIATGHVTGVDVTAALAEPGVLAVVTHQTAARLPWTGDRELAILQSDSVAYRGQLVGGVVAETSEIARHAAGLVRLTYLERPHDVVLRANRPDLHKPTTGANNGRGGGDLHEGSPADTVMGDVATALAGSPVALDATYTTAMYHNHPLEPHATIAIWTGDGLVVHASSQAAHQLRADLAAVFGLDPDRVRVISPYVGGGFGSKVYTHPDVILAVLAARLVPGRPVKLALTRQQMFTTVGYRTPTIQRIQLGADTGGRLTALAHDVAEQTSKLKEFAEQTAVASRVMYGAPNRRTTHRLAALDVPPPTIMRAPGEAPGMFAIESAMDEMAITCGLDPIEFRIRNEPAFDPENGLPFSSRNLVACLRDGARRFGWAGRDPTPGTRRDRGWLVGTGVAASTYPVFRLPGSVATIRVGPDRRYTVLIDAADIGTGTWTTLTQIAADALDVPVSDVRLLIGDTVLPPAAPAGGSTGINSWGSTVIAAARQLRDRLDRTGGMVPAEGVEVTAEMPDNPDQARYSMHAFGAQFAEVRVHEDTGEVRVPRLLGVFAAGRIINPRTARSQFLGGMTMGLSMALFEDSVLDRRFGHVINHDFAQYHIATNADTRNIHAYWLDEDDPHVNPMGAKGIGEIGIVGTAAAIANAAYHATGVRVRDLPITLDNFLDSRTA